MKKAKPNLFTLYLFILLISFNFCVKKFSINKAIPKEDKIKIGKLVTKYQMGKLNTLPDGPISDEQLIEHMNRENVKQTGRNVGVVYIDRRIADMPVGQTRIKPNKKLFLYFPDNTEAKKYQNPDDNDGLRREHQNRRIDLERDILQEAKIDPSINPYKKIYDHEVTFLNHDSEVKRDVHLKNLLNLAVEKEEELFKSELDKENSEYFDKKFNRGYYTSVYNFRKKWQEEHKDDLMEEPEQEPQEEPLDEESKRILLSYELD